ncbi:hypothetical protein GEMRC1_011604 [Eukaryota sp. GEM-RC1]
MKRFFCCACATVESDHEDTSDYIAPTTPQTTFKSSSLSLPFLPDDTDTINVSALISTKRPSAHPKELSAHFSKLYDPFPSSNDLYDICRSLALLYGSESYPLDPTSFSHSPPSSSSQSDPPLSYVVLSLFSLGYFDLSFRMYKDFQPDLSLLFSKEADPYLFYSSFLKQSTPPLPQSFPSHLYSQITSVLPSFPPTPNFDSFLDSFHSFIHSHVLSLLSSLPPLVPSSFDLPFFWNWRSEGELEVGNESNEELSVRHDVIYLVKCCIFVINCLLKLNVDDYSQKKGLLITDLKKVLWICLCRDKFNIFIRKFNLDVFFDPKLDVSLSSDWSSSSSTSNILGSKIVKTIKWCLRVLCFSDIFDPKIIQSYLIGLFELLSTIDLEVASNLMIDYGISTSLFFPPLRNRFKRLIATFDSQSIPDWLTSSKGQNDDVLSMESLSTSYLNDTVFIKFVNHELDKVLFTGDANQSDLIESSVDAASSVKDSENDQSQEVDPRHVSIEVEVKEQLEKEEERVQSEVESEEQVELDQANESLIEMSKGEDGDDDSQDELTDTPQVEDDPQLLTFDDVNPTYDYNREEQVSGLVLIEGQWMLVPTFMLNKPLDDVSDDGMESINYSVSDCSKSVSPSESNYNQIDDDLFLLNFEDEVAVSTPVNTQSAAVIPLSRDTQSTESDDVSSSNHDDVQQYKEEVILCKKNSDKEVSTLFDSKIVENLKEKEKGVDIELQTSDFESKNDDLPKPRRTAHEADNRDQSTPSITVNQLNQKGKSVSSPIIRTSLRARQLRNHNVSRSNFNTQSTPPLTFAKGQNQSNHMAPSLPRITPSDLDIPPSSKLGSDFKRKPFTFVSKKRYSSNYKSV